MKRRDPFLGFEREGAAATPVPKLKLCLARIAAELRGGFEQQAEDRGPIVASEIDKLRLGDEAAKLDQLTRAFAALHLPRSGVMPRPLRLKAIARLRCPPMRRPRPGQRLCECGR